MALNTSKKRSFKTTFPTETDETIDFIRRCLVYNPENRMTVEQALKHPYLSNFADSEPEITLGIK